MPATYTERDAGRLSALMTESTTPHPKRILCFRCRLYDSGERRCRIGKVNPRTKLDTYEVAKVLGTRALCMFNLYREHMLIAE